MKLLYIINFKGSQPLKYLKKKLDSVFSDVDIIYLSSTNKGINFFVLEAEFIIKDIVVLRKRKKVEFLTLQPFYLIITYLFNFYFILYFLFKYKNKYQFAIGETNFGGFLIYFLKKINRINKTVFMNGDVLTFPELLNKNKLKKFILKFQYTIQKKLRIIAFKNDLIWFANQRILDYDKKSGYKIKKYLVNSAVGVSVKDCDYYIKNAKKNDNEICYIGRLNYESGIDVLFNALHIVKKTITNIHLQVIGGEEVDLERYQKLAATLQIRENITFHGRIQNEDKVKKIMSDSVLGIALYDPHKRNVSLYADNSKPKEYLSVGLPVLMTVDGPPFARELIHFGAGITSKFDPKSVAKAICEFLNEKNQKKYLSGILQLSDRYDTSKLYDGLIYRMLNLIKLSN